MNLDTSKKGSTNIMLTTREYNLLISKSTVPQSNKEYRHQIFLCLRWNWKRKSGGYQNTYVWECLRHAHQACCQTEFAVLSWSYRVHPTWKRIEMNFKKGIETQFIDSKVENVNSSYLPFMVEVNIITNLQ